MDIAAWLRELGLERYEQAFQDNEVTARSLPHLTTDDLKEMGVTAIGHRRLLLQAIAELGESGAAAVEPVSERIASSESAGDTPKRTSEAERRQLTVLFCDLVGSTELASRFDPEDMGRVIRAYQDTCTKVIERWGGHVAKYMGDGVLAYFGWPRAHEDEAERAVRSGLAMIEALAGLATPAGEPLAARVGIATGLVMVGELIGVGAAQEQTVVGETPNLAARLQTLAQPGSVVISKATRRLLGGLFELTDLGPTRLKGFAEPLAAFRVVGEGRAEGRFEALHGLHLTPLVGREHELAMLMERWARAKDGDGQVVLIGGEPGIGKSRLLRALREELRGEPHVALSRVCSPYHINSALHPIITQLERAAGFAPDDTPEAKRAKLELLLGQATEQLDEAVPLITALLGVPNGDRYPALNLSPQRQKQRTLELLLEQLAGLARARPVLELYEDLHWADPSTLELLDLLVERARGLPVLVVLTYRPEFRPPWSGHAHVTALPLNRLGRRQGAAIVERIAGGKSLPPEVLEQIVAKTDGVPLFVEELTKTVLESGLLTDAGDRYELAGLLPPLAIPTTLHDSLMARLDRLAPVKQVAQTAAVIGREFSHELLAAVSPLREADLAAALDQLVAAELIFRRGTPPAATYSFKHALVQDAAYQSLLRSRRQRVHAQIAQALEDVFPDTRDQTPEVLGYHFSEAGMVNEAVEYWHRAGEKAAKRSANLEAIRHLEQALELLASLPEDRSRAERELRLLTLLNPAQLVTKGHGAEEVATTLERARRVAQELQSINHLIPATLGLWLFHNARGDFDRAGELTRDLFELARQSDDDGFVLQAHHAAWTTPLFIGDFARVRHHVECALAIYDQAKHGGHAFVYLGHDPATCAHALGAFALWMLGYPEQALRHCTLAVMTAEQLRHPPTLAHALWYAGNLHILRNDHVTVAEMAQRLLSISAELGMVPGVATADSFAGWAQARDGKPEAGLPRLQRGVEAWKATGSRLHQPQRLSLLAEGLSLAGRAAEALGANAEAHRLVVTTGERYYEGPILWQRGHLLARGPDALDEAEAALKESLEVARRQEAKSLELRAAISLARLWAEQGERQKANDLLAPVYDWFTEGFDTADLKHAKALLDELG